MSMEHIEQLIRDLRLANEVEAAAQMDVEDARANVNFYKQKLAAVKARRDEATEAATEAAERLHDAVIQETTAPLMLMIECERGNGAG